MKGFEDRNYYELLGLDKEADLSQIKEAYREIARIYHPDSNYYDEILDQELNQKQLAIFKIITAAYNTLINTQKRCEYDRTLPQDLPNWEEQEVTRPSTVRTNWDDLDSSIGQKLDRKQKPVCETQFGKVDLTKLKNEEEEFLRQSQLKKKNIKKSWWSKIFA